MAHTILMVSIIDGKIHLLNVKRKIKVHQVIGEPIVDADQETVEEYCKKALEIIINSDFPSSNHYWGHFPKVDRRYLKETIVREARQNFGHTGDVRVAFQEVGLTSESGTAKRLLACLVVEANQVAHIENKLFAKFRHKISRIYSLPVALCALVAQAENPSGDFMVIAVGDVSTTIAISSPKGFVKVARQIPLGFAEDTDYRDADRCKNFINEVAKDIESSKNYYLQNFPGAECTSFFMFGHQSLKRAMAQHASDQFKPAIQFGLSKSPLPSLDNDQAAAWAYLFSSLYGHKHYNLLNRQIVLAWNVNRGYQYAMVAITTAIVGCVLYLYQADPVNVDKISEYELKNKELTGIQNEVLGLRKQVNKLNQFSGWRTFYENTYKNQPAWNTLFSELAYNQPTEMVIDSVRIDPAATKGVQEWNGIITGHIKASEWDQGLELLREFGAKLHSSPNFKIDKVRYAPTMDQENRPAEEIGFDFQINAQLTPQSQ